MNQEIKAKLVTASVKITALLGFVVFAYCEETDHLASLPYDLRRGKEGKVLNHNIAALDKAIGYLTQARDHIEQAYAGE